MLWAPYSVTEREVPVYWRIAEVFVPPIAGPPGGLYDPIEDETEEGGDDMLGYNPGDKVECLVNHEWLPATVTYVDPFCIGVRLDDGTETELDFTKVRLAPLNANR